MLRAEWSLRANPEQNLHLPCCVVKTVMKCTCKIGEPVCSPLYPLPCTAIIAAKNEAASIGDVIRIAARYAQEILVVDGKSIDETVDVAKAHNARVVKDEGLGKGIALRLGVEAALHEALIFLDADGSHNPHDIPDIVTPILNDEADMVIGSRILGGSDELSGSLNNVARLIGSQIITLGINLRWKSQLSDSQSGFRAIRKSVFQSLNLSERYHTIEQEMLMRALKKGYRVIETPAHEYKRFHGRSHIRLSRMWYSYLRCWIKGLF